MKMWKVLAGLVAALSLAGCGGGGGSSGCSVFSATSCSGSTTPTPVAASIDVTTSANQIGSSSGETAAITAVVKDANNVALASAPVSFSVDTSGSLTSTQTTTNTSGVATATLSAGSNRTNRSLTVTVRSGSISGSVVVAVSGTTLTLSGPTSVQLGGAISLSLKAVDSKGNGVAGAALAVSSLLNNGLSATSVTTDALGLATVTYTAINAGSDTVTVSGLGASSVTLGVAISGEDFNFVSPTASNTSVNVGSVTTLTVLYLHNGVVQAGKTVNFAATAGTLSANSAVTNSSGLASVNITATVAGLSTVQATLSGVTPTTQATLLLQFLATTPAKLVLQLSKTALSPNLSGTTSQAQVLATVTDAGGNPVKGVTVNFARVADPSGGNFDQPSAVTDPTGHASVQYIAGALTTASDGVHIQAAVATDLNVKNDAYLTVNQSALFIALGTGNVINNAKKSDGTTDDQTYKWDWVVYVTDANGNAVPGVNLTIKALPLKYGKGRLVFDTVSSSWVYISTAVTCSNEDATYNGTLDAGEDTNGNGKLDPGNVIAVTPSTITTDTTGRATISLTYAESYAPWVQIRLTAQAVVSGTESTTYSDFWVQGINSDFTNATVPPAGLYSPFGQATVCTDPN